MKSIRMFIPLTLASIICLAIVFGVIINYYGLITFATIKKEVPPNWRNITPGQSSQPDVINQLGSVPVDEYNHLFFTVNEYSQDIFPWNISVWYENREEQLTVVGVFLNQYKENLGPNGTEYVTLEDMVDKYGIPENVTWSNIRNVRYLFWPSQGVAGASGVPSTNSCAFWQECGMLEIVLFEPMSLKAYKLIPWPPTGIGWSSTPSSSLDARDQFSENPYTFHK